MPVLETKDNTERTKSKEERTSYNFLPNIKI